MLFKNYLSLVNLLLIIGVITYILVNRKSNEKNVYILNQQVFNAFEGKKELESKLQEVKKVHKTWLDSVGQLLQTRRDENLGRIYEQNAANFDLQEREITEKYTGDIWKQINLYISDYGKMKNYDFIFGASGNGSLMFAHDRTDVTNDFIRYANERYKKGE